MSDILDWLDPDEPYDPEVVTALVSMDPLLSDFDEGALVGRDGEPLHPVAHVDVGRAQRQDLERAKLILRSMRDTDLARYEDVVRLGDLARPYGGSLSQALGLMPAEDRDEANGITGRLQRGQPAAAEAGSARWRAELTRLRRVSSGLQEFAGRPHPLLHDGKPVLDQQTGLPVSDRGAAVAAMDLDMEIGRSIRRLYGWTADEVAATAEEAAGKLAELEQRYPASSPQDSAG